MPHEKLDIVIDLIKETQKDVKGIREEQIKQGKDIEQNKESLVLHMKRSDLLEKKTDIQKAELDARICVIETPMKARRMIFDWIIKIGSGAGVMYGIIKLIEHFSQRS